jgi:hypothetical protein
MAAGDPDYGPSYFDLTMEQYGLAPEDIDAKAADVDAAKRRWGIARAKAALSGMAIGNSTYTPGRFDWTMDRFGLAPADIGATPADLAAAKRRWGIEQAKAVLNEMAAGSLCSGPSSFDAIMDRFGLAAEDLGATAAEVDAAKRRWMQHRTPEDVRGLSRP